jgi:hypothetical protein
MKTNLLLAFAFLFTTLYSCAQEQYPESYVCYRTSTNINVDGNLTEAEWGKAKWTNYFVDIEGDKKPKPTYKTRAKMMWDDNYMYFAAEIHEPHIWAKLKERDAVIFYDNDFEIFIDPQGDNHEYYEFEMNAFNTVWDLMLIRPYRDGTPAVDSWDIQGLKSGVKIYGTINNPKDKDKKWTVEVAFPWKVLEEAAGKNGMPKNGDQWRVNFSRVNWDVEAKNGKYEKKINPETGKSYPEHNWVWSPQGVIAMHQPETWGYVQFANSVVGTKEVKYVKDVDYFFKANLMALYKSQKKFNGKHKTFAKDITKLDGKTKGLTLETTKKQFLIYGKAPSGKTWYVNQKSRLWSE